MTNLKAQEMSNSIFGLYVYLTRLAPNKFGGWFYTDIVDYLINDVAKIEWNVEIAKLAKEKIQRYDEQN